MTEDIWQALKAPFPKNAIHWRAQTVTKAGDKAMALAYIDARNVMSRLDEVVGPAHWQDEYVETPRGRVICRLSIFHEGAWITKSDGAGDTDVEGEKGGISDALKRAAVKWGIGRYLYDMPAPWVPCECSEYQGKKRWKRWTADPWNYVKGNTPETAPPVSPEAEEAAAHAAAKKVEDARAALLSCTTNEEIDETVKKMVAMFGGKDHVPTELRSTVATMRAEVAGRAA